MDWSWRLELSTGAKFEDIVLDSFKYRAKASEINLRGLSWS